ncbi:MAG: sulfurtransferase TusA family protein [Thermofilum sp.]|nr:sulfurtransferase TusA family protein [Thermofilum sp.]
MEGSFMKVLDFRGEECPGPFVKAVRELAKMRKGDKVVVLTTSKQCVDLLRQAVDAFGVAEMLVRENDGVYEVLLERTADEGEVGQT